MTISKFQNRKLKVTWTLLLICFNSNNLLKNCDFNSRFISGNEIINYAGSLLDETDDSRIVSLAILKENEQEAILPLLQQLSIEENCDYSLEFRKFRAMYVYENMPSANDDFMHGILKISEIWDQFDFPEDSPNIYYKFTDYSPAVFERLLKVNTDWLLKEFEYLSK